MLNGATCAPGSDGGAVLGGWGPELDAVVAPILPCLGPIGGLGVNHDGVATAEKECRRVETRKGRARKMHRRFFKEAHLNGGPLISGAAQERRMMFLEELVAVIAGEEASSLTGKAAEPGYPQPVERERGSDRRTGLQWQEATSRGEMPAREMIAASILASKSRKAGRLTSSSETRARNPTRAEMQWWRCIAE